uniref:U15-myrmicitoxin-Tb1b n=1 Tax=Tetramorium bicarinatum TaxID=219812 RepID=TX15B_TETBN|nr:U15-MYRTX-Tb1b precursor [Tetramorium bicarinatum]
MKIVKLITIFAMIATLMVTVTNGEAVFLTPDQIKAMIKRHG